MSKLILLRHAKSDWGDSDQPDHDRPLSPRGERSALVMGRYMRQAGYQPDIVVCSTAERTRQTLSLVETQIPLPQATFSRDLYLCGPRDVIRFLNALAGPHGDVLVVGHNPDLELAVQLLAHPGSNPDLHRAIQQKYPTAGLVVMEVAGGADYPGTPGTAELIDFQTPKSLV